MVDAVFMRSGNLIRAVASRLLAREPVFAQVQRMLLGTLDARRALDRNVGRVLAGLNLPSAQELDRLYRDVRALEQEMAELSVRAEAMARAAEGRRCP